MTSLDCYDFSGEVEQKVKKDGEPLFLQKLLGPVCPINGKNHATANAFGDPGSPALPVA